MLQAAQQACRCKPGQVLFCVSTSETALPRIVPGQSALESSLPDVAGMREYPESPYLCRLQQPWP